MILLLLRFVSHIIYKCTLCISKAHPLLKCCYLLMLVSQSNRKCVQVVTTQIRLSLRNVEILIPEFDQLNHSNTH